MSVAVTLLAAGSGVSAGLFGFLVVLALVVGCVLLFRSMNTRLRRVRSRFPRDGYPRPEDKAPQERRR